MNVLVAYASKRGSTREIAEAIADTLRGSGLSVDCIEAGDVASLDPYKAVVLGSAVYMKRWRGDAKHFLRKHGKHLAELPFWVFSSGPVGDPAKDNPAWNEPPRIVHEVEELGARDHVIFGGSISEDPEGFMERAMVKELPPEHRDRRNWDDIRAWTDKIATELQSVTTS